MNKLEIFESQMFLKSNIPFLNFCPIVKSDFISPLKNALITKSERLRNILPLFEANERYFWKVCNISYVPDQLSNAIHQIFKSYSQLF